MILIIAEKPSVAGEIAKVVGATNKSKGYTYGNNYKVSWCVGHLIELANPEVYNEELKLWKIETLPIIPETYITEVKKNTNEQYLILKELMNNSETTEIVCATDAGREGELIFRLVYEKAKCKKPCKRLWISSMEESSIINGLANMKSEYEYDNLYKAAMCRQRADWLIGMNFTRYYSTLYGNTLSTGRVQTPTINLIVNRQNEIDNFIPQTYYNLIAEMDGFKAYKKVNEMSEAERIIKICSGNDAVVKTLDKQDKKENPQPLYDLTTLQRDANRMLGYSAQSTLNFMQNLYEKKLVTYPRTDSRYITKDMINSTNILIDRLTKIGIYDNVMLNIFNKEYVNIEQVVNNSKVTDHHAIIPTSNVTNEVINSLPEEEKNILLLVAYRLISATYKPYCYTSTKVTLDIANEDFIATGREILDYGFKTIEEGFKTTIKTSVDKGDKEEPLNTILPKMTIGNTMKVNNLISESKLTQPPKPFTEDTLLAAMETAGKNINDAELREAMKNSGLGTPATRAETIESIIRNKYINRDNKKLIPTDKAKTFMTLVEQTLKSPELTAEWECQLAKIQAGKYTDKEFMKNITEFINCFILEAKSTYNPDIKSKLFKDNQSTQNKINYSDNKINNHNKIIGICPKCGKNVIERDKVYSCESGCGFVVFKILAGKNITITQIKKFLKNKDHKSEYITGFMSNSGKSFNAYLKLSPEYKIEFIYK